VHQGKDGTSQDLLLRRDAIEGLPDDADDTSPSRMTSTVAEELANANLEPSLKRKRSMPPLDEYGSTVDVESMKQEMDRLRAESSMKDERLRELEFINASSMDRITQLEQALQAFQQQHAAQQAQAHQAQQEVQQQQQQQQQHLHQDQQQQHLHQDQQQQHLHQDQQQQQHHQDHQQQQHQLG
jgi:hypothetical protein